MLFTVAVVLCFSNMKNALQPQLLVLVASVEVDEPRAVGWVRPEVVYGMVHMAKTSGTEINGELAMRFERVCGNKGYSYDFYSLNERLKKHVNETGDRWVNWMSAGEFKNCFIIYAYYCCCLVVVVVVPFSYVTSLLTTR
jgi:hypothetical protein